MGKWLKPSIAWALCALIVATSATLASARGKTYVAGQIVICVGATVATVNVDENGDPVGPAHICPDCALSLIADAGTPPELPGREMVVVARVAFVRVARLAGHSRVTPSARGPPASV